MNEFWRSQAVTFTSKVVVSKNGARYSQTSLYRTRIIWTSAYIEIALWSRPPAIGTGGKMHRIYRTRLYRILGYIEHAAPPHTSMAASFISKSINTSDYGQSAAGRLVKCDTTHRHQCQAIDPPLWRALMHCNEVNVFRLCIFPLKWHSHCAFSLRPLTANVGRLRSSMATVRTL